MSQKLQTTPDPLTPSDVAAILRTASERRQSILIRGAGTKIDWGRSAAPVALILEMRGLNRLLAHAHGDLTATIEAGASLHDVNRALGARGQWLPLDPSFADRATIGGLLATNDSGPLRHRHGTPRDLVIGIQLATTDGVIANAGGRVVKNVAGYDLAKLMTGSFGSLAAIVSATFKLAPLPAASNTLRIALADGESLGRIVRTVMASQLEPVAFDVHAQSPFTELSALLQFASLPQVVDAQIAQARALVAADAAAVDVLDGPAEQTAWRDHTQQLWNAPGAVLRASWLPARLAAAIAGLARIDADLQARAARGDGPACAGRIEILGRAAIGAGLIRIDGELAAQLSAIEQLRASEAFGNVVILRAATELKALVDVWGPQGDRQPLFDSLKRAFDPNGVLNAGRGPL